MFRFISVSIHFNWMLYCAFFSVFIWSVALSHAVTHSNSTESKKKRKFDRTKYWKWFNGNILWISHSDDDKTDSKYAVFIEECHQTERNFFFLAQNMHIFILRHRRGIISNFFFCSDEYYEWNFIILQHIFFFRYWNRAVRNCNTSASAAAAYHRLSSRLWIVGIPIEYRLKIESHSNEWQNDAIL